MAGPWTSVCNNECESIRNIGEIRELLLFLAEQAYKTENKLENVQSSLKHKTFVAKKIINSLIAFSFQLVICFC